MLKWGALLAIVLAALGLAGNLFDEDLSPEAKALLAPPRIAAPPETNGYFLLVGLAAPEGEDAYAWGRKFVRVLAEADEFNDFKSAEFLKARDAPKARWTKIPCQAMFTGKNDCLSFARERPAELRAWLAAHAELMRRYRGLGGYAVIEEAFFPIRSDDLASAYLALILPQRAALLQAAALAAEGKGAEAIEAMAQDLELNRRILEGARTPTTRMIAVGQLVRDYMALSALLKDHPAALAPALERIAALARPLTAREADMAGALRADFRATARLLSTPRALEKLTDEPPAEGLTLKALYKPNATVNLYARLSAAVLDYAKAPATELAAREAALMAAIAGETRLCCSPHNPSGRTAVRAMLLTHDRAMKRVHDLDGLIRLVALQAQVAARGVSGAQVPELVARGAKQFADPYTGRPMQWDAASRQLYFKPMTFAPWYNDRFGRDKGRLAVTLP